MMAKKEATYGYQLAASSPARAASVSGGTKDNANSSVEEAAAASRDDHGEPEDFDSRMLYPDLSLVTPAHPHQQLPPGQQQHVAVQAHLTYGSPVTSSGDGHGYVGNQPSSSGHYGNLALKQEYESSSATALASRGRDYYCQDCQVRFDHADGFVDHVSRCHPNSMTPAVTNRSLGPGGATTTTLNIAGVTVVTRCPLCPATFHRRGGLEEHLSTVHAARTICTSPVGVRILTNVSPVANSAAPNPVNASPCSATASMGPGSSGEGLFCPECKNPFANKYSLMKHLRSTRCRQESEATINKIINDQLTCSRCYKQFGSIQALQKHCEARKCHPNEAQREDVAEQPPHRVPVKGLVYDESIQLTPYATVQVFRCPDRMCSKPCVTLRAFKMHAKCVHKGLDMDPLVEEAKANFICKVRGCGKLFVEEQQLDVHFKHHENYTPRVGKHRCQLCNEAFYQRDMLKKHVLSFHDEIQSYPRGGKKGGKGAKGVLALSGSSYRRHQYTSNLPLKYNPNIRLNPGTLMTVYKCPVEECKKSSCTDMKSFKLHALHIHQDKSILPIVEDVEAKYICQVDGCGKLYLERKQFEIHQRHHKTYVPSKGRYYKCSQCESKFNTQSNLDVHIIQVHMSGREGKNELIFDDVQLEPGTMMTVYHCPVVQCNKRNYLDAKSVRTHCRRFHSMLDYEPVPSQAEAQFICQVRGCRKLFMEPIQIEAHLKHHRNYIPTNGVFECNCCPETFTRKEQLDQHTLQCHTSGMLRQGAAHHSIGVGTIQHHSQHALSQQLHPSAANNSSLNVSLAGSSHLSSNGFTSHGALRPDLRVSSTSAAMAKVVGYQCSICMRKFLHLGTHCNHVNNAHGQPGLQPIEVEMKPRYTCKVARCGRHFMTKNMYRTHMERHQTGKGKRSASCFKCGRTFSQFKSLYQHLVQTHSDVTQEEIAELEQQHAKCPICLSVFRNNDIMRNHMRRHQDDKGQIVHNANVLVTAPVSTSVAVTTSAAANTNVSLTSSASGQPLLHAQSQPHHHQAQPQSQAQQQQQQQPQPIQIQLQPSQATDRAVFGKTNFWSPLHHQHMLLR